MTIEEPTSEKNYLTIDPKFFPEYASCILPTDEKQIDREKHRKEAETHNLLEKKEFHFTVIGFDTGEEILAALEQMSEDNKQAALEQIKALCENFDWKISLKDEYYYIEQHYETDPNDPKSQEETRKSLIQIATIEKLDEFYQQLNLIVGKNLLVPFPHVTLFTNSTLEKNQLRGIGIYSEKQFRKMQPQKI